MKRGKSKHKNKIINKGKKNDINIDNIIDNNNNKINSNIINNTEQCYEKILNEMKNIRATYFRKESNKTLKTSYFTKYLEISEYSLENKKMPFIWPKNTFLKKFVSQLESNLDYEEPIKKIIEILCGDFSNTKKLKKFMNYLNDYEKDPNIYLCQKLCSFYSIQLKNANKKKILFCICLQKDENSVQNTASAFLYFISLTEEWNFEDDANEFINKFVLSDDEKYPFVQFDKSGFFMTKELLFSEVKKINNKEICYPLKNLSIDNKTIFNTALINKKIYHFYNNIEDFIINDLHDMLISQIENEQFEEIILEAIDGKFWKDIKLSNQEKDKIYPSTPFIISGRPGTGKTTIILVKLFVIYYNYFLKKEKLKEYFENDKENKLLSQLRVVFTSFSQELCKEQMKSFIQMVNNVSYLAYKGIPQTEMKNISSFRDVISYPIFTNYRKLMFMIDGSLTFQFFKRKDLKIFENPDDSLFYYDEEKVYECNNYFILSDENFKNNFINFFYRSPELDKVSPVIHMKESNEYTFCKFFNNYLNYKTNLAKKLKESNLNPIEIYAQYISIIKGSFTSHLYPTSCITLEEYQKRGKKITDSLSLDVVYEICMEYENYKRKSKYFDIQDLTNFLIRQVLIELKDNIKLIDYIFIDEIQDLTVSQIFLLILVSRHCKIYAGDTCQTISKVNRFRFSELNNIFYNFKKILPQFDTVESANLNLNYRLNSKILHLSTYMAYFIRECFPNTLDKFQDDFSLKITDSKPMIIRDINNFFSIFGDENTNLVKNLTLSSLHCFICRDKATKIDLKKYNVFARTIEESKGLEYDIVIAYNFFSKSPFYYLWDKLFREENLSESTGCDYISASNLENILIREDITELISSLKLDQYYMNMDEEHIKRKIIDELNSMTYPSLKNEFDIHSNFDFCSELKQFYVIITRPRTFLLFYEEGNMSNFSFFNRMINNGIIRNTNMQYNYIDEIMGYYIDNQMICRNKDEMRRLGDLSFKEEKYEEAAYFYTKAGEENYTKKASIYLNYEIIKREKRNHTISKSEFMELNYEVLNNINQLRSFPNVFYDNENIEAFCYLNLKEYNKAISLFEKKKMFKEIGDIYFDKLNDYEKAFEYYDKDNIISKAIISLANSDKKGNFKRLFDYINRENISLQLGLSEYYNNYKKYINNLFLSCYSKARYIRNVFKKQKEEEDDNQKKENEKEEEKLINITEKNKEKEESNASIIENNINSNINIININNNENNIKSKKKSGKRRRQYQRKKNEIKVILNEENESEDIDENEDGNESDENFVDNESEIINENEKILESEENDKVEKSDNNIIIGLKNGKPDRKKEINENINKNEEKRKEILYYIKSEIMNRIFENINNHIYKSFQSSLTISDISELFVNDIINKSLEYYQKELDKEYLGEEEAKSCEIDSEIGFHQEKENVITENSKEKEVEELKEKIIKFNENNNGNNNIEFNQNILEFNLNEIEKMKEILNFTDLMNQKKNKTHKILIKEIIEAYYYNINMLEKQNEQIYRNNMINNVLNLYNYNTIILNNNIINDFIKEFKLPILSVEFIYCYYINKKEYLLKEIVKFLPEIYYYKSKYFKNSYNNFKDLMSSMEESNNKIYDNIINISRIFIYKAGLIKKDMNNFFYQLFYLNNFFDLSKIFITNINNSFDLLFNLGLSININRNYERQKMNELMSFKYLINYLNFKLRYGLTMFIKTGEIIFDQEQPFITYKFKKLIKLLRDIKNKNYIANNKIILDDINKLISFIKDIKNNDVNISNINILEIIDLFDITSYISLYLFKLYIDNFQINDKSFGHLKEKNPKNFHNVLLNLYKFTLIFNEINDSSNNLKKILVFSLFNIFCANLIPNLPIFDIYKKVKCCLLNKNSILLSDSLEGTYLDIFSKNNNFIYEDAKKMITIFDTTGNNLLIANDILYQIFMLLFSKYINILLEMNLSNIIIPKDPFNPKYKYDGKETFFHEIIYYLSNLNYKIIKDEYNHPCISAKNFWKNVNENCSNIFHGLKTYYPFYNLRNNYTFSIYNYLIGFFFNSVSSPQVLLLFIQGYNDKTTNTQKNNNEMYLLSCFTKIYFSKIKFNKFRDNLILNNLKIDIDYTNLLNILSSIKKNNNKILLISILILRRLLPYILNVISEITKIDTKIYFFENEAIFDNGIKIFNLNLYNNQKAKLVTEYLSCLNKLLEDFSFEWKKYSTYFKNIKFIQNMNFVNIQNFNFYNYGIKKIKKENPNVKENIKNLNYAYDKMYYKIKADYNWNFHLYELLFHSFYLTFADFSINYDKKYGKSQKTFYHSELIYDGVNDYLDYYEQNDYYLNFINNNGARTNISREIYKKIDEINKKKFDYKKFDKKYKLREELRELSKYDYMTKEGIQKIYLNEILYKNILLTDYIDDSDSNKTQVNNIVFDERYRNNNIFVNDYNKLNQSIQRFLFNGYNDDNISKDDYYHDLLKLML